MIAFSIAFYENGHLVAHKHHAFDISSANVEAYVHLQERDKHSCMSFLEALPSLYIPDCISQHACISQHYKTET
jgi:hypothetical protein